MIRGQRQAGVLRDLEDGLHQTFAEGGFSYDQEKTLEVVSGKSVKTYTTEGAPVDLRGTPLVDELLEPF